MGVREFTRRLAGRLRKEGYEFTVQETEFTKDFAHGESVLKSLLVGGYFCEAHFYGELVLIVDRFEEPHRNQAQLTIGDRWTLYPAEPQRWPGAVDELPIRPPDASLEELVRIACALRQQTIVDVGLGPLGASLRLKFEDGHILFINGSNPDYESWTVTAGRLIVVSVPGDLLAVFD